MAMKIEIQSDSSTSNSLTDRLGAGQRKKHIDMRYSWIQERVPDGESQYRESAYGEKTAQMLEGCLSLYYGADHGAAAQKQIIVERRDGCAKLSETTEWFDEFGISHDDH